jgi:hypothetical protein
MRLDGMKRLKKTRLKIISILSQSEENSLLEINDNTVFSPRF